MSIKKINLVQRKSKQFIDINKVHKNSFIDNRIIKITILLYICNIINVN